MYHGILIDQEFEDADFPKTLKVFAEKQEKNWKIYGVEIDEFQFEEMIKIIQKNIKDTGYWYAHFYNDKHLIVVFKDIVFRVGPHCSTWDPIMEYANNTNIPREQLDFWPNRFQDEHHYFT